VFRYTGFAALTYFSASGDTDYVLEELKRIIY